jgi:hypothetical protein
MRHKWKLVRVRLEIVLILTQDRCAVCAKCTIGSEIVLNAPNGSPRQVGHVETVLVSVQYRCTVCAERTIGSKVVLDAPDESPR